jgi:hypothetical protein
MFFIDEQPDCSWGHECNYVFINQINGNDSTVQKQLPPFLYEDELQEVSISFSITIPVPDFTVPGPNYTTENDNCNLYAVLFNNQPYNWDAISHMFCALREAGYPEDNIYVLSRDGTENTNWSLDLDQDDTDDILELVCDSTNLGNIFSDLEEDMGPDDMLFVFSNVVIDKHSQLNEVDLILWGNEPLEDNDFAEMIEPIDCSRMIFSFAGSHSGGMKDDLENMDNTARKTILTSMNWADMYHVQEFFTSQTGMATYNFFLITALRGYYPDYRSNAPWVPWKPIGEHPDFSELFEEGNVKEKNFDNPEAGGNDDGIQQIQETIEYVREFDYDFEEDANYKSQFDKYGNKEYNNAFATEDLLSLHGISGRVETTQSLSGSFIIGGQLSVETGVELTLDNTTKFNVFESEIVIKPGINDDDNDIHIDGGLLIANGAVFTNACITPWKGIQVWGDITEHQFKLPGHAQAQGKLILDKATIENADIAVSLFDWTDSDPSTGGIIDAKSSLFRNNQRAAEFRTYTNFIPQKNNIQYDNISSFSMCNFLIDGDYLHDIEYNGSQIKLSSVEGISVIGCSFINELDPTPSGRAIHAVNAGFVIKKKCTNPYIQPCTNYLYPLFNGFKHAIEASFHGNTYYPISIRHSNFDNNGVGIYLGNVDYTVIVDNNFDLGWTPGCVNDAGTGIYLDNSHSFAIENNAFVVTNPISGKTYTGIHTNNTNNIYDEIYNNTFGDMVYANYAEGKNWFDNPETGLAYYCNINSSNVWDFYVDAFILPVDGIQKLQGNTNRVAANTFSANALWHFDNNGAYEISYFYNQSSGPDVNKLNRVKPEPIQLTNTCPDHYGGGNEVKLTASAYTQKETDYTSAVNSYNTALSNYNTTNDTVYLEQMSHYNMLLSNAAYDIIRSNLSDTLVHDSLFVLWQEKLGTYTTAENMVDYYIQKGDYVTAMNKVDSLPISFTLSTYNSAEYNYYYDFKDMQTTWLDSGRDIFSLTTSEINDLQAIADSSRGTAGAQARGILNFALDTAYFYTNCIAAPDTSQKSSPVASGNEDTNNSFWIIASPNPASKSINFKYSLSEQKSAVLRLFNQNAKLVDEIVLENGSNIFRYNCSNYKSGVYYYSLNAGNNILKGKIVIIN